MNTNVLVFTGSILAIALSLLGGCPPAPAMPDPPDVLILDAARPDGADDAEAACEILVALGCPEAAGVDGAAGCAATIRHAQDSHITDLHLACILASRTRAEVRACGSVRCQP